MSASNVGASVLPGARAATSPQGIGQPSSSQAKGADGKRLRLTEYFTAGFDNLDDFQRLMRDADVDRFAVSIIPGRCGSTLLASICKEYGFGSGDESFNEQKREWFSAEPTDFGGYFLSILKSQSRGGVLYFQITPQRLEDLLALVPPHFLKHSGISVSLIFRRNLFAQAISYYNAVKTGLWHAIEPSHVAGSNGPNPLDVGRVMNWVQRILHAERRCEEAARRLTDAAPFWLYYEDLVAAPFETAISFLRFSRTPVDIDRLTAAVGSRTQPQKIRRDQYPTQYEALRIAFPEMDYFVQQRARHGSHSAGSQELLSAVDAYLERNKLSQSQPRGATA